MTRIHLVSLPHTLLTRQYDWCAYTAKQRRFISMLARSGDSAIVYGPDIADPDVHENAVEYVPLVFEADRKEWFGQSEWDTKQVFNRWDTEDICWTTMNIRAIEAIRERWQPGDILGLIGGLCQQQIITGLSDLNPLVTEWGIGYSGIIPGTHKVFESYAWMHHLTGHHNETLHFFDTVIPNCFDKRDFEFSADTGEYLLYMGRPNALKGLDIIRDIAARTEYPIVVAGQPGADIPGAEYVGVVTGTRKADLLAGARALLSPTIYLEPFGGVAVEAMMSGTPVIATDYGAFTETVRHGLTGYRCRTLRDFMDAVDGAGELNRSFIRDYAIESYSTERGAAMYSTYLNRLSTLYEDGWYQGVNTAQEFESASH